MTQGVIKLGFNVALPSAQTLEVEKLRVKQVRLHNVAERGQHGAAYVRNLFFKLCDKTLDARAFQVRLRAAEVAGDDRKILLRGVFGNPRLAAICERANDRVAPVVGTQDGRHRLERADVKEIEQKGRRDVISMMTESNLRAALFDGDRVENAAPETRADGAIGLAFGHETFDDRVGVLFDDAKGRVAAFQIFGQNVRGKVWLLLV